MMMSAMDNAMAKQHAAGNRRDILTIDSRNEENEGMSDMELKVR
jgi:hypothetical protein